MRTQKQTYQKPAIIHRQVMESIAGACQANDPTNGKDGNMGCSTVNS